MIDKRFFTKINKQGKNVIIDKECNTEIFDMTLACDVLNRLDLKRKWLNSENEQLRTRLQDVLTELYCKDRKLEDLGISIECCDTDE